MREIFVVNEHQTLRNVHPADGCFGDSCTIHRPTDHHMRDWPLWWRQDRFIFERTCAHGIGHPDPDTWDAMGAQIHPCDGCCTPPDG